MKSYLYKSYDILGYVVFIDYGRTHHVLCNNCYKELIEDLRRRERVTEENPIFVDSEGENTCEECFQIISAEND